MTKPRFKLFVDGAVSPVHDRLAVALQRLAGVSDTFFLRSTPGCTVMQRQSTSPEARFRRKVIREYGSVRAFAADIELKSWRVAELLKERHYPYASRFSPGAMLKLRYGLPVRVGREAAP